jgi:hypothetical protein
MDYAQHNQWVNATMRLISLLRAENKVERHPQ